MSDFPHVQTTLLTFLFLLGTIASCGFGKWYSICLEALGTVTLIYQCFIIFPYTPLARKQSKGIGNSSDTKACISILEANVFMENRDFKKLLDLVAQKEPDVVILLETDKKWEEALSSLEDAYPYHVKHPLDNTYGVLVYSRLKIRESSIHFLVQEDVPSVEADLQLRNGQIIRLYVVHPEPPSPNHNHRSTERDAELIMIGKKAHGCKVPVIVAGDLNDVAWSHTTRLFQRLSGLLDPRIGRGFYNTFHVDYPLLRWPLDHLFHSEHFLVRKIERLSSMGSDHFPMFIDLCLAPVKGPLTNGNPEAFDEEDLDESKETLEKAGEGS